MPTPPARRLPRRLLAISALLLVACGRRPPPSEGGYDFQYPEESWAYAVSQILVGREGRTAGEALGMAVALREEIRGGADFASLARSRSDDPGSRVAGGFLGFVNPHHETRFAGAVQVLEPGRVAGPLETPLGFHVLLRHPFEEGRRLEAEHTMPLYGFTISAGEGAPHTREEGRALAEEAHRRLLAGELSLADAAGLYGDAPLEREDGFMQVIHDSPEERQTWDQVGSVPPGQLAPVLEGPRGFAIVARGRYFRSIVRHILVQHVGSVGRPLTISRTPEQAFERAQEALAEAKKPGARWADVVARYSDDPETVQRAGGIGAVTNGSLTADLEAAILETKPGEIADRIAASPSGFHVIWRVN